MLNAQAILLSPALVARLGTVDEFKGLWNGLEEHTSALNLLGDFADFGRNFREVLGPLQDYSLTPAMIRLLHASQNGSSDPAPYKESDNTLTLSDEVPALVTAPASDTPVLMERLCEWVNESLRDPDIHPLVSVGVFTALFLEISPFEDHNLKTAKFLMTLLLLKAGYSYAPYAAIDPLINVRSAEMGKALAVNQTSLVGTQDDGSQAADWGAWLQCFFEVLQDQTAILKARLGAREIAHLPTLSVKIMKLFDDHQRLQMKEIEKLTKGKRSTIKLRLNELVEGGYLKRHGAARATWYGLV